MPFRIKFSGESVAKTFPSYCLLVLPVSVAFTVAALMTPTFPSMLVDSST
jgi:hypothetical protein